VTTIENKDTLLRHLKSRVIIFPMPTNVEVTKKGTENSASLLRRFTRKVQGSGIVNRMRKIRYQDRSKSDYVKKKGKLKSLKRKDEIEQLIKMGRMPERTGRRR